ncbi:MAG: hypothetical protein IH944_00240 [Armatimonadetes bacterium]|nr:hypothetical protein [Armatimonadota bacterium]
MTLVATLIGIASLAGMQETVEYRDKDLDIILRHPKEWRVDRKRLFTQFRIPLSDGTTGIVELYAVEFRQSASDWQAMQKKVQEDIGRIVERQWQEEILGVPLLLTRIRSSTPNGDQITIAGLLYSATAKKMNFRVIAPVESADEADQAWRSLLLTLRTISGKLPLPEDPTKPLPSEGSGSDTTVSTYSATTGPPKVPVRGEQVLTVDALETKITLWLPRDWSVGQDGDRRWIEIDGLKGKIELEFQAGGRAQALTRVRRATINDLKRFKIVRLRDEPKGAYKPSGAYVVSSLRIGETDSGELCLWTIVGAGSTVIYKLRYESTSLADYKDDRKVIEKLIRVMYADVEK